MRRATLKENHVRLIIIKRVYRPQVLRLKVRRLAIVEVSPAATRAVFNERSVVSTSGGLAVMADDGVGIVDIGGRQ